MAQHREVSERQRHDYAIALTRLFIEALNARDFHATRALVSEDVELRGPNRSSLRGRAAASELLEAAAHIDLIVVRTAIEEVEEDDDGSTRVTTPIRELARGAELFRTAAFHVRDGVIASYETLGND